MLPGIIFLLIGLILMILGYKVIKLYSSSMYQNKKMDNNKTPESLENIINPYGYRGGTTNGVMLFGFSTVFFGVLLFLLGIGIITGTFPK